MSSERSGSTASTDVAKKRLSRRSFPGLSPVRSKDESLQKKEEEQNEVTEVESADSRMLVLAEIIRVETEKLQTYLKANGIAQPSLSVDGPDDFPLLPDEIQKSRQKIVFATKELTNIVRGPRESVRYDVWSVSSASVPISLLC
jgi:hypothetical protein